MNYGFEKKPSGAGGAIGCCLAAVCGVFAGILAELVVMAFTMSLLVALPSVRGPSAIALYIVLAAIPAGVFASVGRQRRAEASMRVLCAAAFTILGVLVIGELSGTLVIQGSQHAFYIVPVDGGGKHSP